MTQNASSAPLSPKMRHALELLDARPDEGSVTVETTWADRWTAFVNVKTARALEQRGLVSLHDYGEEWGIKLTGAPW